MRHHHIHRGVLAAATIALASASATAADDFRGTFRGSWPDGQTTELTVIRIDDDGQAYGAYCHRSTRHVRHFLLDLHPDQDQGVTASLENGVLRFQIGNGHWAFHPAADPDIVRMAFRRDKTRELDLERATAQTCASRLVQLTPPANATDAATVADTMPDDPEHWAIGSWTVTRPTGLPVELTIVDVKSKRGYGIYCNLRGPTYTVLDVHPDGLDAKVTTTKITFRIGKIRFEFKRTDDPDIVDASRQDHRGRKTLEGHRTDEPACASRIAAL